MLLPRLRLPDGTSRAHKGARTNKRDFLNRYDRYFLRFLLEDHG